MPEKLSNIELDYDNTWRTTTGEKLDGLIDTDDNILSISQRCTFLVAPPHPVGSLAELLTLPTPPPYLHDAPTSVLSFRSAFLPIEHPCVMLNQTEKERTRKEALAHANVGRQNALKEETSREARRQRMLGSSFGIMAVALGLTSVIMMLGFVAVLWVRGS